MSNQNYKCKGKENIIPAKSSLYREHNMLRYQEKKKTKTAKERSVHLAKAREYIRNKRRYVLEPSKQENNNITTEIELLLENTLSKENIIPAKSSLYREHNMLRYQEKKKTKTAKERSVHLAKAREYIRNKRRYVLEPSKQENNNITTEIELLLENTL
ncbi:11888_t:CDS:2, partial [Racocetra persica]